VSENAVRTWRNKLKETGSLENKELNRKQRKIDLELLRKDAEEHPDDFNKERGERFGCSGEAIRLVLTKLGITRKKYVLLQGKGREKKRGIPRKSRINTRREASICR
jgi:transposase